MTTETTLTLSNVSYATKANAKRALKKICTKCLQHANEIIVEVEGRFHFNEDLVEQYMSRSEWDEVYGSGNVGFPDETIKPSDEKELAAEMDKDEEVIKLEKREAGVADIRILAGLGNVMNTQICPECGSEELYTGRNDNGLVVDDEYIIGCHHCDWKVDTRKTVKSSETKRVKSETQSATMKTSMKLDRRISVVGDGQIYKNAYQMWKANPTWMTSSQQDMLTAKLYAAAKKGEKIVVEINGRAFELVAI
jgi:hypothetical protein